MARFSAILVAFYALLTFRIYSADSDIVINEVMCNVKGSDTTNSMNEFVEIYNKGSSPVDVGGWGIYDGGDTNDTIGPFYSGGTTVIPPGGYGIIFDPDFADDGSVYNIPPGATLLKSIGDTTLGDGLTNSGDIVAITSAPVGGSYTASFAWSEDPGDGVSWEKIDPDGGDDPSNWARSTNPSGSTPGRLNSVTQAEHNLSISPRDISFSPERLTDEVTDAVTIGVSVRNSGRSVESSVEVRLYSGGPEGVGGPIGSPQIVDPIPSGGSATVSWKWRNVPLGFYEIYAWVVPISGEGDSEDNLAHRTLPGGITINEFMAVPGSDWDGDGGYDAFDDEWVEIYNATGKSVDLGGWAIAGDVPPSKFIPSPLVVPAGGYSVIYGSTVRLGLVNDGADIYLVDPDGDVFDFISYRLSSSEVHRNLSLGRVSPGVRELVEFKVPTPGGKNDLSTGVLVLPPENDPVEIGFGSGNSLLFPSGFSDDPIFVYIKSFSEFDADLKGRVVAANARARENPSLGAMDDLSGTIYGFDATDLDGTALEVFPEGVELTLGVPEGLYNPNLRIFRLRDGPSWGMVAESRVSASGVTAGARELSVYRLALWRVKRAKGPSDIEAYPNPVYPLRGQRFFLRWLPPGSRVAIYTIAGELIRTLDREINGEGLAVWDLRNDRRRPVASGVYIYMISAPSLKRPIVGKVAVIK